MSRVDRVRLARAAASCISGLTLAAGAAWLLGVRPRDVLGKVAGTPPWMIVCCLVSGYVVLALQTLRWHQVMRPLLGPLGLDYGKALWAQTIGAMVNALLPARAGDLLRAQYLGAWTGTSRATILGTEVVDRWLDWWGWVPVVALLALTSRLPAWIHVVLALFAAALLASGAAMIVISRRPSPAVSARSRLAGVAASFRVGLDAFASRRTLAIALFVAPLPWMWEAAVLAVAGRAFDVHLTYAAAFCVLIGSNVATAIPAPGGVGPVETGGALMLALFGVDRSSAVAFLFVYHFTQLAPAIATGAVLLALRPRPVFAGLGPKPLAPALQGQDGEAIR